MPKVLSVNVGLPRVVEWHGRKVRTSIWKTPAAGRVRVGRLNLEGDEQSDLSVHGGAEKAVYAYPRAHYAFWANEMPGTDLPWGAFGENLTTEGMFEDEVMIGDCLKIGSCEFAVTQPRMPCFKLGIRLGRDSIVKPFLQSRKTGFYLSVPREGSVAAGDAIEFTLRAPSGLSVSDVAALYGSDQENQELLSRAVDSDRKSTRLNSSHRT